MTSPAARVLEMLELLQSSGLRTVGELADRLGVDERTVRRDIARLRDLDIPVETTRGRYGGYRLAPGFRMPPLMLTDDEAVAALMALTSARVSGGVEVPAAAAATAAAKIRRSLPAPLAVRVDALLQTATVHEGDPVEPVDATVLLTAAAAIRDRRPVALTYRSGDATTHRSVQPHDLVAYRGRWYLVGLDSISRERRTFRLDRVQSLRALRGTFPAASDHDALEDLVAGFARARYRHLVRLRVQADARHIARHLPPSTAELDDSAPESPHSDPWHLVTLRAERLEWLPAVLLALDRPIVIEEPEALRDLVRRAAQRLGAM